MRNEKGQFTTGNQGRHVGSKNKNSIAKKEELEKLFKDAGGFDTLFASIAAIDSPKDKANTLLKVMEFFMSKEKSLEISGENPFEKINLIFEPSKVKLPTSESQIINGK